MPSPLMTGTQSAAAVDSPPGTEPAAAKTKTNPKLIAVVFSASLLYLAGLFYYAATRPIDGDEGFYTTAARLVWEGKTPYKDFFFQQAPLLPYLYSWIWAVHPRSLVAMRMLSAACGGLEVLLLGLGLISAKRLPTKVALAAFAAVLLNPYSVSWNVVVKTFAVANALMTIATICLYIALRSGRLRWFFASGLALGVCVSTRSLYGLLIPAVLLWMFYQEFRTSRRPYPKSLTFLAGALAGGLPMIFSFVRDPHAFIFNNLTYHHFDVGYMISANGRIIEGYQSAGHVFIVYFAMIGIRLLIFHPYFTIQFILAITGILSLRKLRRQPEGSGASPYTESDYLYFQLALLMLLIYLATILPHFPPYDQYFDSPLVPLLIPFVAEGLRVTFRAGRKRVIALALAAPILFGVEIGRETARDSWHPVWQLSCYREVTRVVEANSGPDEVVMSFWPGFVFESGRRYFPGIEDHFVYRIMNKISPEERARYHVISKDQVMRAITGREINVLVVHPWVIEYYHDLSPRELQEFHEAVDANYSLVSNIRDIAIYRRRPTAAEMIAPSLVRYRPNHDPLLDWVYNGADIDRQKVVWARDMGAAQNEKLLRYYSDRRVWLLEADEIPPTLAPYPRSRDERPLAAAEERPGYSRQ
jgi:Dolichyl-phosphate-mannose-protein mannosyltransferase